MASTLDGWLKPDVKGPAARKRPAASNAPATSKRPTATKCAAASKRAPVPDFDDFDDVQLLEALQSAEDECPGFDLESGTRWIYPTNFPVRQYQLDITRTALFNNTLVALPTGLGKTLIAAVVIYNYQRWYPSKKILFMAPTKPLVAQQIDACCNIMRLPAHHCCTVTGSSMPKHRMALWKEKRIFFLTPQIVQNDLHRGICPAEDICLLVVDEAHRAQGRHSYVEVVRELHKTCKNIRVLGLSATPGENMQGVQQVVENLLISRVELRSEDSADVRQYAQDRSVEQVTVALCAEIEEMKALYLKLLTPLLQRLRSDGNLWIANMEQPTNLRNVLVVAKKKFQAGQHFNQNNPVNRSVEKDYAIALSLAHSFEILQTHGLWCLYQTLVSASAQRAPQMSFSGIRRIFSQLESHFSSPEKLPGQLTATCHPKMAVLKDVVNKHFQEHGDSTRVIIFSQFRISVEEIAATLRVSSPLVSIAEFVGQSNSGTGGDSPGNQAKGLTQKEQQRVLDEFRSGRVNTLVATSVAEEGLDIGSVDLIVCFDVQQSSLRMVQRMGRTGRKRNGKVVILLVPGIEDKLMSKAADKQKKLAKEISQHTSRLAFYPGSPRMVPTSVHPEPMMMPMDKAQAPPQKSSVTAAATSVSKTPAKGQKRSSAKQRSLSSMSTPILSSPLFQYATGQSSTATNTSSGSFVAVGSSGQKSTPTPAALSCEDECAVIDCVHKFFQPPVFVSPRLRSVQARGEVAGRESVSPRRRRRVPVVTEHCLLTSVHRVEHSERTLAYVELFNSCGEFSSSASCLGASDALLLDPVFAAGSHCPAPCAASDRGREEDALGYDDDGGIGEGGDPDHSSADVIEQSDLVPLPPSLSSLFDNLSSQAAGASATECHANTSSFCYASPSRRCASPSRSCLWDHGDAEVAAASVVSDTPVWETAVVEDPAPPVGSAGPLTSSTPCKVALPRLDGLDSVSAIKTDLSCRRSWLPSPLSTNPKSKQAEQLPAFFNAEGISPATCQAAFDSVDDCLASPRLSPHRPPQRSSSTADVLFCPMNGSSAAAGHVPGRGHLQCTAAKPGTPRIARRTSAGSAVGVTGQCAASCVPASTSEPLLVNDSDDFALEEPMHNSDGHVVSRLEDKRCSPVNDGRGVSPSSSTTGHAGCGKENSIDAGRLLPWLDLDLEEDDSEEMNLLEAAEAAAMITGGGGDVGNSQRTMDGQGEEGDIEFDLEDNSLALLPADPADNAGHSAGNISLTSRKPHSNQLVPSPVSEGFDVDLSLDENLLNMLDQGEDFAMSPAKTRTPACSPEARVQSGVLSARESPMHGRVLACESPARAMSPKLSSGMDDSTDPAEHHALAQRTDVRSLQRSPSRSSSLSDSSPVAMTGQRRRRVEPDWLSSQPVPAARRRVEPDWLSSQPVPAARRVPPPNGRRVIVDSESESSQEASRLHGKQSLVDTTTDESMLVPVRRKAKAVLDTSADLSDLTPPAKISKKYEASRKSEVSKRVRIQSDDTDSDFEAPSSKLLVRQKSNVPAKNSKHARITQPAAGHGKRAKKSQHCGFLLDCEAQVDDDEECSSDEDVNNTYYDVNDSFIDDDGSSQLLSQSLVEEKQKKASNDMQAMYLQSLRSPRDGDPFGAGQFARGRQGVKLRVSHRHQFLRQALGYADSSVAASVSTDEDDEAEEDNGVHDILSPDGSEIVEDDPIDDDDDGSSESQHVLDDDEEDKSDSFEDSHLARNAASEEFAFQKPSSDFGRMPSSACQSSRSATNNSTHCPSYPTGGGVSSLKSRLAASKAALPPPRASAQQLRDAVRRAKEEESAKPSPTPLPVCSLSSRAASTAPGNDSTPGQHARLKQPVSVKAKTPAASAATSSSGPTSLASRLRNVAPAASSLPALSGPPRLSNDSGFIKFPKRPQPSSTTSSVASSSTAAPRPAVGAGNRKGLSLSSRNKQTKAVTSTASAGNWLDEISLEDIDQLTSIASTRTGARMDTSHSPALASATDTKPAPAVQSHYLRSQPTNRHVSAGVAKQTSASVEDSIAEEAVETRVSAASSATNLQQQQHQQQDQSLPGHVKAEKDVGQHAQAMKASSTAAETPACTGQGLHILVGSTYPPYQQILSGLRHRHSAEVTCHFCQLQHTGVVVSQGMIVECVTSSDLAAMNRRRQLSQRIQQHRVHFARVIILVQSSDGTALLSSGCEDFLTDIIAASHVLLLWSCSPESTVSMLVDLAKREAEDHGAAIVATPDRLGSDKMVELLCNISAITLTTAMQIRHVFGSVAELCAAASSPQALRQRLNFISQRQAKNLAYYFSVQFNPVMLPHS